MKTALPAASKGTWPRMIAGAALAAAVVASPIPAMAQDNSSEARLRKIETEIRALQRSVFPGGDGRFFEPQISPNDSANQPATNTAPSTTAITDILARLDALELQLQRLTALTEENTNALVQLDERVSSLETARLASISGSDSDTDIPVTAEETPGETIAADLSSEAAEAAPAATGPSADRLAAVQAITKPQSDDPADDEYSYGFRLWNAGFYPEARQQLSSFVEQYPDHWRITWGRNLLGRAFLDDGMPEEAARWFLRNYQADRTAARAPDSLLFLAESMIAMEDTRRACIALAEFGDTYPAVASGRLSDQYEANRRKLTCEG